MDKRRPNKFCKRCGHKLRATKEKLEKHYDHQHNHEEAKYLEYGELPLDCKYINFPEYLKDPSIEL